MSHIFLNDLIISAKHGVHQREKEKAQRFKINLSLEVDTAKAFTSDNVEDTVNYSELRTKTIAIVENNSFDLIERLAQEISTTLLSDKRIKELTISIAKLDVFETGIPSISVTYTNS